ncbi:MFS transporter [Planifilum fimeticola]|jgi:DHA1 family bicyclomycin/chloramphenicol resistance-like MFS transporter
MNRSLLVYLVSFAAFLGPFTQSIYTPMLPEIQRHFHTSAFVVNLTISIFTLGLALMQPVYGPLADFLGRRKVLLTGILIYTGASVGAAMSPTIWWLIFFRALQAVGIAAGSVIATTVIGDLFQGKRLGRAMGTFQMLVTLGPVAGPVIGGIVGGWTGFYGVFWVLTVTGLLIGAANIFLLPETKPESETKKFHPADMFKVVTQRTGLAIALLGFIQYYTLYNYLVFLPHLLSGSFGLSSSQKGLSFLPLSLCIVVGSFLGGRLQEKWDRRKFLVSAGSANVLATLLYVGCSSFSLPLILASTALFGLFLGLSLPVQTTLLATIFQENRATAMGGYNFARYLGMAAGPLLGALLFKLGSHAEFLFAAAAFAGVVGFSWRQFHREWKSRQAA